MYLPASSSSETLTMAVCCSGVQTDGLSPAAGSISLIRKGMTCCQRAYGHER